MGKGNPFGNMGGMGNIMKAAQKMQQDVAKLEDELGDLKVQATSGGGMVTAVANGRGEIIDVKIDPSVVDPEDVEMLQDLIVSAVREAIQKGADEKAAKMQEITGGLGMPGLF